MTTIYCVRIKDAMEGEIAFPTLRAARECSRNDDSPPSVILKIKVAKMPIRELLCAVFNREGFAEQQEEVK